MAAGRSDGRAVGRTVVKNTRAHDERRFAAGGGAPFQAASRETSISGDILSDIATETDHVLQEKERERRERERERERERDKEEEEGERESAISSLV